MLTNIASKSQKVTDFTCLSIKKSAEMWGKSEIKATNVWTLYSFFQLLKHDFE